MLSPRGGAILEELSLEVEASNTPLEVGVKPNHSTGVVIQHKTSTDQETKTIGAKIRVSGAKIKTIEVKIKIEARIKTTEAKIEANIPIEAKIRVTKDTQQRQI